jgi:hypothetical protein
MLAAAGQVVRLVGRRMDAVPDRVGWGVVSAASGLLGLV